MRLGPLDIYREPPGTVSRGMAWVAWDDRGYLYAASTIVGLVWQVITGWRADRNMVG